MSGLKTSSTIAATAALASASTAGLAKCLAETDLLLAAAFDVPLWASVAASPLETTVDGFGAGALLDTLAAGFACKAACGNGLLDNVCCAAAAGAWGASDASGFCTLPFRTLWVDFGLAVTVTPGCVDVAGSNRRLLTAEGAPLIGDVAISDETGCPLDRLAGLLFLLFFIPSASGLTELVLLAVAAAFWFCTGAVLVVALGLAPVAAALLPSWVSEANAFLAAAAAATAGLVRAVSLLLGKAARCSACCTC